jgi:hypothetical protein
MSAEQKAVYDARQSAMYAEERLQREEIKQQQLARAKGPGRPVKRPMLLAPEDLDKKIRELRDSRQVAEQPALQHPSMLQAVACGVVSRQGSWAVGGGSAGGVAHATGAGCRVGVAASEGAGLGTNGSVGMAGCSVMQGHDGPLYKSSQPVRNMPDSNVADTGHAPLECSLRLSKQAHRTFFTNH